MGRSSCSAQFEKETVTDTVAPSSRKETRYSKYKKKYYPVMRLQWWRKRGAKLTNEDIQRFDSTHSCEICNKLFNSDKVLDHDHTSGLYRGALCRQCNASLGKLGDDLFVVIHRVSRYAVGIQERKQEIKQETK